jgi:hypothetical protein
VELLLLNAAVSHRPLWVAGSVMLATLALIYWLAPAPAEAPPPTPALEAPAPKAAPAPHMPSSTSTPAVSPAVPAPPESTYEADPGDPFGTSMFDRPAPEVINDARARYEQGLRLHAPLRMKLYRYGEENPDDARPQLIMAFDEVRLKWWGAAAEHYERALEADPETRDNPKVLEDLVTLYLRGQRDRAGGALSKHYGTRALHQVDRALTDAKAAGDARKIQLLEGLRGSL